MSDGAEKNAPTELNEEVLAQRTRVAWKVISVVLALSCVLAVFAYARIKHSASFIDKSLKQYGQLGKKKSMMQCAEDMLPWSKRCEALQVLCDDAISKVVGACLKAQPRRAACKALNMRHMRAKFSFFHCKDKKLKGRRDKKVCAKAYGAVWAFCRYTNHKAKQTAQKTDNAASTKKPKKSGS